MMPATAAAVRSPASPAVGSSAGRLLPLLQLLRLLGVCLLQLLRLLLVALLRLLGSFCVGVLFCQLLMFLVLLGLEFLPILGLLCH